MSIPAEIQELLSSSLPQSGTIDVDDVRQRIRKLQDKHAVTLSEIAKKQAGDIAALREETKLARAVLEARVAELEAAEGDEGIDEAALSQALAEQEVRLQQENEAAIQRLRREKDLTLEALETDARQQLALLSQEHETKVSAMQEEHRATVERIEQAHQDALSGAVGKEETDSGALQALEENWKAKVTTAEQALAEANARFQTELEDREAKNASFIAQLQNENRAQTELLKQNQGSAKETEELRRKAAELEAKQAQAQAQLDELNASHSDEIAVKDEEIRHLQANAVPEQSVGGADPEELAKLREQMSAMRLNYEQRIREVESLHVNEMMDMREQLDESHMGFEPDATTQRVVNKDLQAMQAMVEAERLQMLEAMQTVAAVEADGQRKLQKLRDEHRQEREELKGHLTALSQAFRNSQTNDPSAVEKIAQIIALLLSQHR